MLINLYIYFKLLQQEERTCPRNVKVQSMQLKSGVLLRSPFFFSGSKLRRMCE